jgi:protein-tyrosine phosphatase
VSVLQAWVEQGITDVAVTPHLRATEISTRGEEIIERRGLLLDELRAHAPPGIGLHPGFEIMLDAPLPAYALTDRRYAVAGSRYYLIEYPLSLGPDPATGMLKGTVDAGIVPLVAHPERYHLCAIRHFRAWRAIGARLQVDATTLTRPTSRGELARELVREGLADILAADSHGDRRTLRTGRLYLEERNAPEAAHLLTVENPRAILEDRPTVDVPPVQLTMGLRERVRTWFGQIER